MILLRQSTAYSRMCPRPAFGLLEAGLVYRQQAVDGGLARISSSWSVVSRRLSTAGRAVFTALGLQGNSLRSFAFGMLLNRSDVLVMCVRRSIVVSPPLCGRSCIGSTSSLRTLNRG